MKPEIATFAAGCFWGVEADFRMMKGVTQTTVGYSGGHTENPAYEDLYTNDTGHAESVQVAYDPSKVSYEQLLVTFWDIHNPTMLHSHDQYRSVIFYHNDEQKRLAEQSKVDLERSGKYPNHVVTQIVPAAPFYRAEEYHQRYLEKMGLATCHADLKL